MCYLACTYKDFLKVHRNIIESHIDTYLPNHLAIKPEASKISCYTRAAYEQILNFHMATRNKCLI